MKIFDSHLHIIDPAFPLVENRGYLPPAFTSNDYIERVRALGIKGGAIVSGSFQAFDQAYMLNALQRLNREGLQFVGVTQVEADVSDLDLIKLNAAGVRAVRFNLFRGGSQDESQMEAFARRVYDLFGWHVELYISGEKLLELADRIERLPSVSIDHLGLEEASHKPLLELVDCGVKVKATGFGRIDFDPIAFMKLVHQRDPSALMFGTDLPSTRAREPFSIDDISRIESAFDSADLKNIFWQNAADFYRLEMN